MKKILFFILFLYSIDVTYSQEKVTDSLQSKALEEVIVTATRTERSLSSLPLPSAIITADAISKAFERYYSRTNGFNYDSRFWWC